MYGHQLGGKKLPEDKYSATGRTQLTNGAILNDNRSRFHMSDFIRKVNQQTQGRLGYVQESLVQ